jgi:hypothetical protein
MPAGVSLGYESCGTTLLLRACLQKQLNLSGFLWYASEVGEIYPEVRQTVKHLPSQAP